MAKQRKSLASLKQIDGQAKETKAPEFLITTADQLWGDRGDGKFPTHDLAAYGEHLNELNLSDMQREALKLDLLPINNKSLLKDRMLKAHQKHFSQYRVSKDNTKEKPITKEMLQIAAEGR